MKIFHKLSKALAATFFAALFALWFATPTFAADVPDYRIQISPALQDVGDLKPGETYTGTFKVQNTGSEEFEYEIDITPYSVINENYTPDFDSTSDYTNIVKWITVSKKSGKLEPNGEDDIDFTIKVPSDVAAGGQYAVIAAKMKNEGGNTTSGSAIEFTQSVGMKVYSNINGKTRKTANIVENKVPGLLFNPPVSATSVVENTGNTHAIARYVMQVYPLFGDEEVYTNEDSPMELTILPETRRLNTMTWPNAPHLGIFRVKQTVTIFDQISTTEKVIFLCPIWLLFIVIAIIFCVVFWIVTRIRGRKQDKYSN